MEIKTKIIATVGPSIESYEMIKKLVDAGVSGFRINFSHGNFETWKRYVEKIKKAESETGRIVAIIGDLQGPNVRIGEISKPIELKIGNTVKICKAPSSDGAFIPLTYSEFFDIVEKNDVIQLADGSIKLKVEDVSGSCITASVILPGTITSRKSISILNKDLNVPFISEQDETSLKFAINEGFSHVMASFVEKASQVRELKEKISALTSRKISIFSKIETERGVKNIEEILKESDGIVIARGDLGAHFPMESLPVVQKTIANKTFEHGKPLVIATQLLTSMLNSPIPTRSEIVDVYNAVLEHADALMLTNETAVGKYPVECIEWLKRIIREAEKITFHEERGLVEDNIAHRFASGIADFSKKLDAKVVIYTYSGLTAQIVAIYRPPNGLFAGVPDEETARRLSIIWGTEPIVYKAKNYEEGLEAIKEILKQRREITSGDLVIETYRLKKGELHSFKIVTI